MQALVGIWKCAQDMSGKKFVVLRGQYFILSCIALKLSLSIICLSGFLFASLAWFRLQQYSWLLAIITHIPLQKAVQLLALTDQADAIHATGYSL